MKINIIINLFIFIIFQLLILSNNSTLFFSYPTAITLYNRNILVVEKNGIYICDENFTSIISVEYNFTEEEDQIKNEANLS